MILVIVEHAIGKISKRTREMVQAAQQLARDDPITLLVLGHEVAPVAAEATAFADAVLVADVPALSEYDPEIWAQAVSQIASEAEARLVLIGGSRSGREYSPRVAVRLNAPLIEDAIRPVDHDGQLDAERYSFLALVTERVRAHAPEIIDQSLALATIVKMSGEEPDEIAAILELRNECDDPDVRRLHWMRQLRDRYSLQLIAVTRASRGSILIDAHQCVQLDDSTIQEEFVHPVGAGMRSSLAFWRVCLNIGVRRIAWSWRISFRVVSPFIPLQRHAYQPACLLKSVRWRGEQRHRTQAIQPQQQLAMPE